MVLIDGLVVANWSQLMTDRWHHREFGEVSNTSSSSVSAPFMSPCRPGEQRAGQGSGWLTDEFHSQQLCICLPPQVTGSCKWVGHTPGGSSPRVHGNGLSSAVSRSSRGVRWHHRAGSAAGWDGVERSRRERGHDGDAAVGGGWRGRGVNVKQAQSPALLSTFAY